MSAPLMSYVLTGVHVLLTRPDPGRWLLGLGRANAFAGFSVGRNLHRHGKPRRFLPGMRITEDNPALVNLCNSAHKAQTQTIPR